MTSFGIAAVERGAMNQKVGVWIDHRKAIIVFASEEQVTAKTLESDVGPHTRYSDRANYPEPDAPEVGRGEKAFEGRYREHLRRYYDELIHAIGRPESLLIFGPGEAKLEFRTELGHVKALSELEVEVKTTDKLTDKQVKAYVMDHYGLSRKDDESAVN